MKTLSWKVVKESAEPEKLDLGRSEYWTESPYVGSAHAWLYDSRLKCYQCLA